MVTPRCSAALPNSMTWPRPASPAQQEAQLPTTMLGVCEQVHSPSLRYKGLQRLWERLLSERACLHC